MRISVLAITMLVCRPTQVDVCPDVWTGDQSGCLPADLPTTPSPPQTLPLTGGYEAIIGVTYRETADGVLEGDLYLPPTVDPTKGALVVVHGGGWEDCNRRRDVVGDTAFGLSAILGVPVFNIEYRLRQEGGGFPANLSDVLCATQFLSEQAATYGFAPDRVALIGESAGAHLSLMAASLADRADVDPTCGVQPAITGVVAVSPPVDFPTLAAGPVGATLRAYTDADCLEPVGACSFDKHCDRCVDASPLAHVCTLDTPVMVVTATDGYDPLLSTAPMQAYVDAIIAAGGDAQLVEPTAAEMAAAGCGPGALAHGFTPCLMDATGVRFAPFLSAVLSP